MARQAVTPHPNDSGALQGLRPGAGVRDPRGARQGFRIRALEAALMEERVAPVAAKKETWAVGDVYEPYVGRWSRLVARDFLAWLAIPTGKDWLDVGCGTGALTQAILESAHPKSVRGVEPSGFLEHAKANIQDPPASFHQGDAQALPVEPPAVAA